MLALIIRLSALTFGVSYATLPSAHLPSTQALTSLNERMNEMINALYASSPVLAKLKAAATPATKTTETAETASADTTSTKNEYEQYYQLAAPLAGPQLYASPTPTQKTLEAGVQPTDYAYPMISHPVPRSVFPPFQFPMPTPYPMGPYPCEYHHAYPEYPVFPTPFLPPTLAPTTPLYAAPCHCPATAPFPPSTPAFLPATPSYAPAPSSYSPPAPAYSPAPPSLPMTSYQHVSSYQSPQQQSYQISSSQGEANAAPQFS